jgi:hypothetical protein
MNESKVFIYSRNNKITYLGQKDNIEEAKELIKEFTTEEKKDK